MWFVTVFCNTSIYFTTIGFYKLISDLQTTSWFIVIFRLELKRNFETATFKLNHTSFFGNVCSFRFGTCIFPIRYSLRLIIGKKIQCHSTRFSCVNDYDEWNVSKILAQALIGMRWKPYHPSYETNYSMIFHNKIHCDRNGSDAISICFEYCNINFQCKCSLITRMIWHLQSH